MSVEKNRLISLIEFSQQSARLRGKPAATVAAHDLFSLYEHEIQGLPGIRINVSGTEGEIECDGDKYHGADKWADDNRGRTRPSWLHTTQADKLITQLGCPCE